MADTKKCAHEGCTCIAASDSNYCCEFCADSTSLQTLSCDCGHTGCKRQGL